jgi:hypothetical protein
VLVAGLWLNIDQGKVTADAPDPARFRVVIEVCLSGNLAGDRIDRGIAVPTAVEL